MALWKKNLFRARSVPFGTGGPMIRLSLSDVWTIQVLLSFFILESFVNGARIVQRPANGDGA